MSEAENEVEERVFEPLDRFLALLERLDDEDVAIGERIDVARARQARRHFLHAESGGHARSLAVLPADHRRNVRARKEYRLGRLGQDRVCADLLRRVDFLPGAACGERGDGAADGDRADHRAASTAGRLSQPATRISTTPMIDRVIPIGTTAVQPSRS